MDSFLLASSRVAHKKQVYVVSTIDRDSSVVGSHGMRYAETMVWSLDQENQLKEILHQAEGPSMSLNVHLKISQKIFKEGEFWKEQDDGM